MKKKLKIEIEKIEKEIKERSKQILTLNSKIENIKKEIEKIEMQKKQNAEQIKEIKNHHTKFFILPPWRINNNETKDEQLNKQNDLYKNEMEKLKIQKKQILERINNTINYRDELLNNQTDNIKTPEWLTDNNDYVNNGQHLNQQNDIFECCIIM